MKNRQCFKSQYNAVMSVHCTYIFSLRSVGMKSTCTTTKLSRASMCEWPLSQSQEHFSDYNIMENETVLHSQPTIGVQELLKTV